MKKVIYYAFYFTIPISGLFFFLLVKEKYLINGTFEFKYLILILTGNYFFDALIDIVYLIPIILFLLLLKYPIRLEKIKIIPVLSIICIFSTIICIISQLYTPVLFFLTFEKFVYIRAGVGFAFLTFIFSLISFVFCRNKQIKMLFYFGIYAPVLMLSLVPLSLALNHISWIHFWD